MTALILACLAVQDGDLLFKDAIDKLKDSPGWAIKGSLEREDSAGDQGPFGGFRFGMGGFGGGTPFEGDFTAKLAGEKAAVRASNRDGELEVYRSGDKTVKRLTWTKGSVDGDGFAKEILGLLDLEKLRKAAGGGKFEAAEEESGDEGLRVVRGTLDPDSFKSEQGDQDDGGGGDPMKFARRMIEPTVKEVRVKARFDKDGNLRSLELAIERELEIGGIVRRFGGQGGDEMPGGFEMPKFSSTTTLKFEVQGTGEEHAPSIPKELQKHFEE